MVTASVLLVFMTAMLSAISTTSARILDVIDNCPQMCHCDHKLLKVNCKNGTLTEVPRGLPASVQHLILTDNAISELHNDSLTHLPELRYLNFANNGLVTIAATAFSTQSVLHSLDLHGNSLSEHELSLLENLKSLVKLDLSENSLTSVSIEMLSGGSLLKELDLSKNNISNVPEGLLQHLPNLLHLNLSHNQIKAVSLLPTQTVNDTEPTENRLQSLDISYNQLSMNYLPCAALGPYQKENFTAPLKALTHMYMGHNHNISNILPMSFVLCPKLQHLDVSYMDDLRYVDMEALSGLTDLHHLTLSHNRLLTYLHALTFTNLTSIVTIDLSHNSLTSVNDATFRNLTTLETVRLTGNPWHCDCDSHWMGPVLTSNSTDRIPPLSPDDFICASPPELAGLYLVDILPSHNFSCHRAYVVNYTHRTAHSIGSSAVLNCVAAGDPSPYIAWITPRKDVIRYHPAFVHPGRPGPQSAGYHTGHSWHGSSDYAASLPASARRMHVLANGSLYIDYVQRHDAGRYTCLVHNHLGNNSVVVHFHLNYLIITRTMVQSVIIGFLSAAIFLAFGLITAMIRYLVFTCSREQRQKRKSIREILEGLETFRTDKMDKLSAYKTAKIDQLAAFKTAKVDKLRGYKNITVTTLVHYLHRSREHYTNQTVHIKENCAQQVEKLRESYSMQRLKFKDYRSHQVDKIKENYNGQLLKIRLYGSGQLERLRDQYKLQQQHILKLLELLDIGNCMSVIEAECLRSDSMIFNTDLNFDLEAAVYAPASRSESFSGSEYMTAGDDTDNSCNVSNSGSVVFDVNRDSIPLNTTAKTESVSNNTLTQIKVDLASADLKPKTEDSKDSKESKGSKDSKDSKDSKHTKGANSAASSNSGNSQVKVRHSRRKHRHKQAHLERQGTPDDEDEQYEKRPRRRVSPNHRRDKREHRDRHHKAVQARSQVDDLESVLPEARKFNRDILNHAAEIDKTLEDIATDIDNLKREPLNLSIPDLNLDLSQGVYTEPEDELTPVKPVTTATIENEMAHMQSVTPPGSSRSTKSDQKEGLASSHHEGAARRKLWQQGKDQPSSTDVQSTDYESAQEPESRGNTPQVGFYEHTGSPQSFASFPSTPSTPTLGDFHPVVILDPSQLDRSMMNESNV